MWRPARVRSGDSLPQKRTRTSAKHLPSLSLLFLAENLEDEMILYGISRCMESYKPAIGEEASQLKNVGKRHVLTQGCPVCCGPVIEGRTRDH
jgi:hypothetical protein